jgi:Zn-dependent protease with chaperone function
MSLKTFHLVFIIAAIILADMFGAWALWHRATLDGLTVVLGVVTLVGGLALTLYAFYFVRKMEREELA